jgi:hypothetical protein
MAPRKIILVGFLLVCVVTIACSQRKYNNQPSIIFVGSTPCDSTIKTLLKIPASTDCDFIRWELSLQAESADSNFLLNIAYGESQPNTPGFKNGGEKLMHKGTYAVRNKNATLKGEFFDLKIENTVAAISLCKLNEGLLHLLTPSGGLMVGNGGWSYTLNRKSQEPATALLPTFATWPTPVNDKSTQVIFDGRTPCQQFAAEHQMNVSSSCFKLKWRLILNRDPVSHKPTTYTIRKVVDNIPRDVSGKWQAVKGANGNTDALVYQLDPDKSNESIYLLVGDENVLFFLNQEHKLYVGNSDFSFTLNRRQ